MEYLWRWSWARVNKGIKKTTQGGDLLHNNCPGSQQLDPHRDGEAIRCISFLPRSLCDPPHFQKHSNVLLVCIIVAVDSTRVDALIFHCVFLLTRWWPARTQQRRHSEATWNQQGACFCRQTYPWRNIKIDRWSTRPIANISNLATHSLKPHHGPPLPDSTSTKARTELLLQLCSCQLRSYLNIPPSLPTIVTFKTCTFAATHRQPTSFDPQPPRFNDDGDRFRQIWSHLTTRGPLIFQRPFSNLQNTLDNAVLDLSSRSTGAWLVPTAPATNFSKFGWCGSCQSEGSARRTAERKIRKSIMT